MNGSARMHNRWKKGAHLRKPKKIPRLIRKLATSFATNFTGISLKISRRRFLFLSRPFWQAGSRGKTAFLNSGGGVEEGKRFVSQSIIARRRHVSSAGSVEGENVIWISKMRHGREPRQRLHCARGSGFMSLRGHAVGRRGHSVYKTWRHGRESGGRSGVRVLLFRSSTTKGASTRRFQEGCRVKERPCVYSLSRAFISSAALPLSSFFFFFFISSHPSVDSGS